MKSKEQLLTQLKSLFIAPNISVEKMNRVKKCYKEIKETSYVTEVHESMVNQLMNSY